MQGDEHDRFPMETNIKTGGMLGAPPAIFGHGEAPKTGSGRKGPDWGSKRAVTPLDMVITQTTERHIT